MKEKIINYIKYKKLPDKPLKVDIEDFDGSDKDLLDLTALYINGLIYDKKRDITQAVKIFKEFVEIVFRLNNYYIDDEDDSMSNGNQYDRLVSQNVIKNRDFTVDNINNGIKTDLDKELRKDDTSKESYPGSTNPLEIHNLDRAILDLNLKAELSNKETSKSSENEELAQGTNQNNNQDVEIDICSIEQLQSKPIKNTSDPHTPWPHDLIRTEYPISSRKYDFLDKNLFKIYKNVIKHDKFERNEKIYLYKFKKSINFEYFEWEDKQFIFKLIEYFVADSIDKIYAINVEIKILKAGPSESEEEVKKKINVKVINGVKPPGISSNLNHNPSSSIKNERKINLRSGKSYTFRDGMVFMEESSLDNTSKSYQHGIQPNLTLSGNLVNERDMLRSRIKPDISLDEYAEIVMDALGEDILSTKKDTVEDEEISVEDESSSHTDIRLLRTKDDENDDKHVRRGYTDNVG